MCEEGGRSRGRAVANHDLGVSAGELGSDPDPEITACAAHVPRATAKSNRGGATAMIRFFMQRKRKDSLHSTKQRQI